jgi:hypothetical protein
MDLATVALLVIFYVQNASDVVSTWIGVKLFGLHEANPVAKYIFGIFGIRLGGLLLKIPYLVGITLAALYFPSQIYWPLLAYDVAFSFVILNNLFEAAREKGFFTNPPSKSLDS